LSFLEISTTSSPAPLSELFFIFVENGHGKGSGSSLITKSIKSILLNNEQMQLFAVNFIPLQVHSTCFGCFTHPSSGVQFLTVFTAIGKKP
jgi:hypothetical protein